MTQSRKIVQIATSSPGHGLRRSFGPVVVGLADDGSIWASGYNPDLDVFEPWEKLPPLPQTDEEGMGLIEERKAPKPLPKKTFLEHLADHFGKKKEEIRSLVVRK